MIVFINCYHQNTNVCYNLTVTTHIRQRIVHKFNPFSPTLFLTVTK